MGNGMASRHPQSSDRSLRTIAKRHGKSSVLGFLGLLVALLGLAHAPAAIRAETLVLAHEGRPDTILDLSARDFAERVARLSNGEFTIEVVGAGAFGRERELLEIARYGKVDLALVTYAPKTVIPEFAIFDIPYLVSYREQLEPLDQYFVQPVLGPIAEKYALKIVGFWEFGFRHIVTSSRPVTIPSDLKGMKVRTPSNEWSMTTLRLWGASPVRLPFAEVAPALERGIIDGQEAYASTLLQFNLAGNQRYLSLTGHGFTPAFLIAGQDRWWSLDGNAQEILQAAAQQTQQFSLEKGAELEKRALEKLELEIIGEETLNRDWFRSESKGVYDVFAKKVPDGANLLNRALKATRVPR